MKNYFLCLCIFAKLWLKLKALSAFKTLYIHLYFSIYIFKDLILPKKPTHVQQHFVSILMEKAWSLKKRNLNKAQKRRLEINNHPIQLTSVFRKSRLEKKSKSTQQQQPNQTVITQQPQKPTQNISKITN